MRSSFALFFLVGLLAASCQSTGYRRQDEDNIRRLFRIPPEVQTLQFASGPDASGRFEREGLWISAVFQFSEDQFETFLRTLNEPANWRPVPFEGRVPELDQEFTSSSCSWSKTKPPSTFLTHSKMQGVQESIRDQGQLYYCTFSVYLTDKTPGYFKRLGCNELNSTQIWALTLGILDKTTRRLYAKYRM